MTSLSAPAPSQDPSDWFALLVSALGLCRRSECGVSHAITAIGKYMADGSVPSMNGDLGNHLHIKSLRQARRHFCARCSNERESPVANTKRERHRSLPARRPRRRLGAERLAARQVWPFRLFGVVLASNPRPAVIALQHAAAPQSAPPPAPPPATFAPEPTPFPYDMGSFIAGLRAAWEAEQATKRMTAQRGSPLAPPSAGTSAWGSHGPPHNTGQPYQQ